MKITIYYDRLFDDGSLIDIDTYVHHNDVWDMGIVTDVIAEFYKLVKGNIKVTLITIERV